MHQPTAVQVAKTAAAAERNRELGAIRAIDDPAKLARAARIVRIALERQRLSLADLGVADRPHWTEAKAS